MMNRYLILVSLFILPILAISQQDSEPMRIEFEARADVFELIPCGENGVLLFYESVKSAEETNKAWVFIFYNKNLEPLWSKEINLLKGLAYIDFYLEKVNLYLAFQKIEKVRADEFNLQVLKIDVLNPDYVLTSFFIPDKSEITCFEAQNEKLVVGLNFEKEQALLIMKDLTSQVENVVRFADYPTFLKDTKIDSENGLVYLAVNIYVSRKESSLYLNSYDFSGKLVNSSLVAPPAQSQKLLNAQIHLLPNSGIFVLGSFNNLNGRISYSEENEKGDISEGFYIAKLKGITQEFIKFHNLLDFKNITAIFNNEELSDVDNALKKKQKGGKTKSMNYNFLIHDLQKQGEDFVLLAEAYYPQYQQVSTMSYDFYGRPMPYYYTVFEGYRFFNAFVAGFDMKGNLKWSNGMKIWETLTMRLSQKVDMYIDGSDIVLFLNNSGKVTSKVMAGYTDIGETENTKIQSLHSQDVLMETTSGSIRYWYGNNFLAYGYQTLKNNALGGGSKRHVFYFNKLTFD